MPPVVNWFVDCGCDVVVVVDEISVSTIMYDLGHTDRPLTWTTHSRDHGVGDPVNDRDPVLP